MPVPCARCAVLLPSAELERAGEATCTACGSENQVRLFPAAFADVVPAKPAEAVEGHAACFDHPSKSAVASCAVCGRFVCGLCAVETAGGVWCPSCTARAHDGSGTRSEVRACILYDSWALLIPLVTLILWPLTLLSAPVVLALAILRWRRPISLVRRNRWRFATGLALALIEGGLWIWLAVYLVARARAGA
jgi:hypothetical protein